MNLKTYINGLADESVREAFAEKCGVTLGHLRNVMYELRPCAPDLAVTLEHLTRGELTCEQLRPDVTWLRVPHPDWPNGKPLVDYAAA